MPRSIIPINHISTKLIPVGGRKNLEGKYCLSPFVMIGVDPIGDVSLCGCASWQPSQVGNLFQQSLQDILQGHASKTIRQSIIDGGYEYCNASLCGIIANNDLNTLDTVPPDVAELLRDSSRYMMPREIYLAGDVTCNLSCPSCRNEVWTIPKEERSRYEALGETLKNNLFSQPTGQHIRIMASTSGEVFASVLLMKFLSSIDAKAFPNLTLHLQTNGLLAPSRWHRLQEMQHRITRVIVTIDAASKPTYEKLRRGGKWKDICEAMSWLSDKKKSTGMQLYTRMVVQADNWREIRDFYDLSLSYDADLVEYTRILDWRSMSRSDFQSADVLHCQHPEFTQALRNLVDIQNLPKVHVMGGTHPKQLTQHLDLL